MGTPNRGDRHGRRSRVPGGPLRPVFDSASFHQEKPDYKTAALCKQVRRIVSLTLSGECGDPVLQSLLVDEVLPAPNAGRLLVRVFARTINGEPTVIDILRRLEDVHGLLRSRVAEAIARKRTPELTFDIIPIEGTFPARASEEASDE